MAGIKINANAKINISLDVLSKRADGYHEVSMIMQEINLRDIVEIEKIYNQNESKAFIELTVEGGSNIPCNENNTAYKAAQILLEKYNIKSGVRINIIKNIPSAAGMAGGSADAAAVIKGINELFQLKMSVDEMLTTGKRIGADVPFCIIGKTALAEGIGERLTSLPEFSGINLVIVKPNFDVSTPFVYKAYDAHTALKHPDNKLLIQCIRNKELKMISREMYNVLEEVTANEYPLIKEIEKELINEGAIGAMMSGSGPTVFGIFESKDIASQCSQKIKTIYKDVFCTNTTTV